MSFSNDMREESLLQILSANYDALYYVDFDKNTIKPYRMNPVIEATFGDYFRTNPSYEDAMTAYTKVLVAPEDKEEMFKRAKPEFIREKLKDKISYSYDFRVNRDGKQLFYRFKISNLDGINELHQAAVGFADVSQEMERINMLLESRAMIDLVEKDKLTGLYSKEFFFKKVEEYIIQHPDERLMLWTSDIEGLKVINDKYGMDKGDEVLFTIAGGSNNYPGFLFGGRVEGDKLSVLMKDVEVDLDRVNKLIPKKIALSFPIPNVTLKLGIYHIRPGSSLSVQGIYDRTLLAINSIKHKYGRCIAEYDDELRKNLLVNRQIIEDAEDALKQGEFKVYFQPKISMETGKSAGAEALTRWIHPEFGFMNPGVFIPLFEQNGFITQLDLYIWEEVCKSLANWKKLGLPLFPVSVNISRRDFEQEDIADKIINMVDRYGIDHSMFHIEITESAYSDNPDKIVSITKKLHNEGFVIELDDFGTGYSSMNALSSLDLDIMKLDMSIIKNDIPGTDKNVLEFSMQLARMMKLKTVAEGVETEEQAERIKSLGGDYIQGYLYSKPLPIEEFERYICSEK